MPKPLTTIRVLANPYAFIDEDGDPAGVCPCPPDAGLGTRYIAAEIDTTLTKLLPVSGPAVFDGRPVHQSTKYRFSKEPVEVRCVHSVLQLIRTGSILAADQVAFRAACGAKGFVAPAELLEQYRAAAAAQYEKDYADHPNAATLNAVRWLGDERTTPPAPALAKKAATASKES